MIRVGERYRCRHTHQTVLCAGKVAKDPPQQVHNLVEIKVSETARERSWVLPRDLISESDYHALRRQREQHQALSEHLSDELRLLLGSDCEAEITDNGHLLITLNDRGALAFARLLDIDLPTDVTVELLYGRLAMWLGTDQHRELVSYTMHPWTCQLKQLNRRPVAGQLAFRPNEAVRMLQLVVGFQEECKATPDALDELLATG